MIKQSYVRKAWQAKPFKYFLPVCFVENSLLNRSIFLYINDVMSTINYTEHLFHHSGTLSEYLHV
jgi:hypothetical protein